MRLEEDPLEFDWSAEDARHRDEIRAFLASVLPDDWEEISKHGPGSDAQSAFSKTFCAAMAERVRDLDVQTVVAPAMGGLVIGQEVARQLGTRFIFVEKDNESRIRLLHHRLISLF